MFNAAISSISMEITRLLQRSHIIVENIISTPFPYLAKEILKIILNTKRYQKLSIQVLTKTITSCAKVSIYTLFKIY